MPDPSPKKEESLITAIKRILGMEDVRKLTEKAGRSPSQRGSEAKGPPRPYRKARTAMEYQKKLERLKREREERKER